MTLPALTAEWLEAGGDGGFASGTVAGYRIRAQRRTAPGQAGTL